ncbi:MAG: methionine--tRNA ligase [Candidatus Marinamargulisbacteria bacterium]
MKKTLLVTSALPYANGDIHLGHLVEHIQTDTFVRYQRLMGHDCHYMCADDAHGTAIMLSAKKQGVSPEEYIHTIQTRHMADFAAFNIEYDNYYTTHSPENDALSCEIYHAALADDGIATRDIDQYFCNDTQQFLADRYIKGTCPKCHAEDQYGDACEKCYATYDATALIDPISVFSGKPPVLKSSTHYFFKLDKYKDTVREWLATHPVIDPVKNKLNEWFDQGLNDWDISRDAPYFGFKIPNTQDKYFYVWLDAPVGYIATTQHWAKKNGQQHTDFWKNEAVDIHHFIGKDILYFHTLFWPAMLSVSGYQLPKKVHVHGFLTVNGEKMSKSRGTFILARDYARQLNPDSLRYYYAAKLSPSMDDIDFSINDFVTKINSDVLGKYINIASRIGAIVNQSLNGTLGTIDDDGHTLLNTIRSHRETIQTSYDTLNTNRGMRQIMAGADLANQYIDTHAPWALVKTDPEQARIVCTVALNALRLLTIYLMPVMPDITRKIHAFLNNTATQWDTLNQTIESTRIQPYTHILKRLKPADVETLIHAPNK